MSSLILNPSIQDAIFNGGSCQLYWNQEKIWPTAVVLPANTLRYRFSDPDLDPTTLTRWIAAV